MEQSQKNKGADAAPRWILRNTLFPVEPMLEGLQQNPKAAIIKALDRCNNVSTMAGSFTREKLQEYIVETETYIYPLLTYSKAHYPQYGEAIFVLQYQIMSLLETIKAMSLGLA